VAKGLVKNEAGILLTKHLEELGFSWIPEHWFHPARKWRFDYLAWNERGRVAIEIEGGLANSPDARSPRLVWLLDWRRQ